MSAHSIAFMLFKSSAQRATRKYWRVPTNFRDARGIADPGEAQSFISIDQRALF